MTKTATNKARLEARRAELQQRLTGIERELDAPVPADFSEQATLREEDEVLERLGTTGLIELRQIDAALARISTGDYGICLECGAKIAQERLDLLPWAPLCAPCASAAGKHAH